MLAEIEESQFTYTTEDEVEFLFELADKQQFGKLHTLRRLYETKEWNGEGMHVDKARVLTMLDFILERRAIGV